MPPTNTPQRRLLNSDICFSKIYWGTFLKHPLRELTWVPLIFEVNDPCQVVYAFLCPIHRMSQSGPVHGEEADREGGRAVWAPT